MSCPPEQEATVVVDGLLAEIAANPNAGLTFGGSGLSSVARLAGGLRASINLGGRPPTDLEAFADATWSRKPRDVYGLVLTYFGAAVVHTTKCIRVVTPESSMLNEGFATSRAGDIVELARLILEALGNPPRGETFIGTDNLANAQVCNDEKSAGHCKHSLRRYSTIQERTRRGSIAIGHIPDAENPADFLTKWLPRKKLLDSVGYVTGQRK